MLVSFTLSNFLSFDQSQTFSMKAGKYHRNTERIYRDKTLKLAKCNVIFGGNASGKTNLIEAFSFVQNMVKNGLPIGFSNKYFRQNMENQVSPTKFELEILLQHSKKSVVFGFSMILSSGHILEEYLYEIPPRSERRLIYTRDLKNDTFKIGEYFKYKNSIEKLTSYCEDTLADTETLFLTSMNHGKTKMYSDNPELKVLRELFLWFHHQLTVSNPRDILTGYPYFSDSNLREIADLLNALGTGISDMKIIEVPIETVKNKISNDIFKKVVADLERSKAKAMNKETSIMLRSYKEFYTFELQEDGMLTIKTIEFSHEKKDIFFRLTEESDGTARLLDLIEILLRVSDDKIFIIDEIDRCLHPMLTTKVIELFLKLAKERNTQLIVTSHESRLLASDILRNDEICFITKNSNGASVINPLEQYQLRADKKVYAALFDGTLNEAMPQFDDQKVMEVLEVDKNPSGV